MSFFRSPVGRYTTKLRISYPAYAPAATCQFFVLSITSLPARSVCSPRLVGMIDRPVLDQVPTAAFVGPIAPGTPRFQRIGLVAGVARRNLTRMESLDFAPE